MILTAKNNQYINMIKENTEEYKNPEIALNLFSKESPFDLIKEEIKKEIIFSEKDENFINKNQEVNESHCYNINKLGI